MKAHNVMEDIVVSYLDGILSKRTDVCDCSRCRDMIVSIVLNNLPPKYITTESGAMFAMMEQVRVEQSSQVLRELVNAIKYMKEHPLHSR